MKPVRVLVSGSLAFDRIFDYPGKFREAILPEKLHQLNVSFTVGDVRESFGGTAGNIAYSLALLGIPSSIICSVGNDFMPYQQWLKKYLIDLRCVKIVANKKTAGAYIITDQSDNQITAFQPGAMLTQAMSLPVPQPIRRSVELAILSPGNVKTMLVLGKYYARTGLPYIFDPGQVIPILKPADLRFLLQHCLGVVSNDYEFELMVSRARVSAKKLRATIPLTITTLGSAGSYFTVNGVAAKVPAAKASSTVDPTGAGDAFRAGFIAGLLRGAPIVTAVRMGTVSSVYTVEKVGTQTHHFTKASFTRRFQQNFQDLLPA